MYKLDLKNIVFGFGIGMIVTSIMGIIYTAGMDNSLNKEEIIAQAKKYGMIDASSLIQNSSTSNQRTSSNSTSTYNMTSKLSGEQQHDNTGTTSTDTEQKIIITINQGDSSETVINKLITAGLLTDKILFENEMKNNNLESKINTGTYKIRPGAGINEILNIITVP